MGRGGPDMAIAGVGQNSQPDGLVQRLNELGAEFGGTLETRVSEVRGLWAEFPTAPCQADSKRVLARIHEIVHALAGAGKSFGFPSISQAATPLDGLFRLVMENDQPLSP